jgi:hypothetical protein
MINLLRRHDHVSHVFELCGELVVKHHKVGLGVLQQMRQPLCAARSIERDNDSPCP